LCPGVRGPQEGNDQHLQERIDANLKHDELCRVVVSRR
jgi:hypothetical protein